MTNLSTAQREQIVYSVLTLGAGGWEERGKVADMHAALRTAKQLSDSRQFLGVKVDKHFFDTDNDRFVSTTILDQKPKARRSYTVYWLLLVAVLGGLASFAVTYFVVNALP
jgi:hypothetical protein